MHLTTIATKPNLKLAWRRITTGSNHQYKRYFRHLYSAYELALDENLKDLRVRLLSRAWRAHAADRVYLPKASGLQRPLTLLHLEDQIVLQAIANLVAGRVSSARKSFLYKTVFSNVVQSPRSIFFFKSWRRTYTAFTAKVDKHYGKGLHWVADFDLAAFYETISHELLLRTAYPRLARSDDVQWVRSCLSAWSAESASNSMGHGLPQGPLASDLLAEVFLLPVDKAMQAFPGYVRYVDDMRLFARTEADLRRALRALEISCRNRGLIPQVGKFAVKLGQSAAEARGMLPSVGAARDSTTPAISPSRAEKLIRRAVGGRPLRVVDKSRLRFVMYRAEPSPRLLRLACLLMPRHPEHIDAFAAFLGRYGYRTSIRDCCLEMLAKTPYPYVAGEMWHLLAQHYEERSVFSAATRRRLANTASDIVRDRTADIAVKWGAAHFICAADAHDGRNRTRYLRNQNTILQGIIGPALPASALTPGGVIRQFLISRDCEPGLGIASAMQAARVTPISVGIRAQRLPPQLAHALRKLGLIRSRQSQVDVIGEEIDRRYGTSSTGEWRRLLGGEYAHALGLLVQAEAAFRPSPSYWLSHQNSFNQAVFLALQRHFVKTGNPAAVTTTNAIGQLVDYGVTLDANNRFSRAHGPIAAPFRSMNTRRNRLPGSHPYEKKSAAQTKYLTAQERNRFVAALRSAYSDLLALCP